MKWMLNGAELKALERMVQYRQDKEKNMEHISMRDNLTEFDKNRIIEAENREIRRYYDKQYYSI